MDDPEQQQQAMEKVQVWMVISLISITLLVGANQSISIFQSYEWLAMLYLIKTQKNRPIEKILYDFNAEVMDVPLKDYFRGHQLNYRKGELLLRNFFYCNSVVSLLVKVVALFLAIYWSVITGLVLLLANGLVV